MDHLHEHFVTPVVIRAGRYMLPTTPGYSITMLPASLERYAYPTGAAWTGEALAGARPVTDRLAGKVCLITGAGSGIGRATALAFAPRGRRVAVADIDMRGATETVRLVEATDVAAASATQRSRST